MQHRGDGDASTEVLFIGGNREHGLGRGLEEQLVDDGLVVVGDVADRRGECKDDVEIGHGKQFGFALLHPGARRGSLALGAMPIATAVIGNDGVRAVLTARNMASESRRAAALDRTHDLHLREAHMAGIGGTPCGSVVAEDVRDLQSCHSYLPIKSVVPPRLTWA